MQNKQDYDTLLKFLLIGDSGVGKTCFLVNYCEAKEGINISEAFKCIARQTLETMDTSTKDQFKINYKPNAPNTQNTKTNGKCC
ncbi:hypothetical protein ABPG72_006803 [Tetrahymena utriculariae]